MISIDLLQFEWKLFSVVQLLFRYVFTRFLVLPVLLSEKNIQPVKFYQFFFVQFKFVIHVSIFRDNYILRFQAGRWSLKLRNKTIYSYRQTFNGEYFDPNAEKQATMLVFSMSVVLYEEIWQQLDVSSFLLRVSVVTASVNTTRHHLVKKLQT